MRYRVRVAGKVFESENTKALLKRAVEAKKAALKVAIRPSGLGQSMTKDEIPTARSF